MSVGLTDYFHQLQSSLPNLVEVKDLISIGMYKSPSAAYIARQKGECPPFMHIPNRGIVYPRNGVIEFLKKVSHDTKDAKQQKKPVNIVEQSKKSWGM